MKKNLIKTLSIALVVCMLFAVGAVPAFAAQPGHITANGVNFRSGPGTGYAIKGTFDRNTNLTITDELSNGWCAVIINNYAGYVYGSYVSYGATSGGGGNSGGGSSSGDLGVNIAGYVNGNGVNMRSGSSTAYGIVASYNRGQSLTIIQELNNGWCYVMVNGTRGYIYGNYVSKGSSGGGGGSSGGGGGSSGGGSTGLNIAGYINRDGVSFRSGPGIGYDIRGTFNKDQAVTITSELNSGWCGVIINGYSGYVYGQYVSKGTPSATTTGLNKAAHINANNVPAYTGTGNTGTLVGTYNAGKSITLMSEESNGWCGVTIDGVRCYVYGKYVSYG